MHYKKILAVIATTVSAAFCEAAFAVENCPASPQRAAADFVRVGVENPLGAVDIIQPKNLASFRARLQQIVDNRYSPDSSEFRRRLLGDEWDQERILRATDKELVGEFLRAGEKRRKVVGISDIQAESVINEPYAGKKVRVSYRLTSAAGSTIQKRDITVSQNAECWLVDVPIEAWVRLEEMSKVLKESRRQSGTSRQGPSRVALQVLPASEYDGAGMKKIQFKSASKDIWVSTKPIATEVDVVDAYALWDCEPVGLGPEEPAIRIVFSKAGSEAIYGWTKSNIGSMLAVVLDSEVVVYARVAAAFGSRMTLCLPGKTLEQADARTNDLLGTKN